LDKTDEAAGNTRRTSMKFLAIIEITPETMILTLDRVSVIDTNGSTLPHKTWLDLFAEYPKQTWSEVIEMWGGER